MADLKYYDYPGYGVDAKKNYRYSQAVRVGDTIHVSGQGSLSSPNFPYPSFN